jgi:hypothetical protein
VGEIWGNILWTIMGRLLRTFICDSNWILIDKIVMNVFNYLIKRVIALYLFKGIIKRLNAISNKEKYLVNILRVINSSTFLR